MLSLLSGPQVRVIQKGLEAGGSASKTVSSRSSGPGLRGLRLGSPCAYWPSSPAFWPQVVGLLRCQLDSILIFGKWVPPFLLEGGRLRRNPLEQLHS